MVTRRIQLGFAPTDDCKQMLLDFANSAASSVKIADYSFNMSELVDILIAKHQAGLDVSLILDKSQASGSTEIPQVTRLKQAGVPYIVGTSQDHKIMHLKVIIVDGVAVGSGSYNFTEVAGKESNNFRIEQDPEIASLFLNDWQTTHDWIQANEEGNG